MDAPILNVIGQLVNLKLGRVIVQKYLDLVVYVHINQILIQSTLIELRASINIMTMETTKSQSPRPSQENHYSISTS